MVQILHQGRRERPDRIALYLGEEIAQRNELLTAREREILEGRLESEIASAIQRLLQDAEAQRIRINDELARRPTSTGVRYRLLWPPLGEQEGAPLGLEAARKRLLNASADLWTAEDRRVIGTMLQSRIAAEREAAAADAGAGTGTLADQLARALDYRRWHRFRVERWQDGSWRKLSGPASSGERALGLTVPLFAAVASFYSHGASKHAPRLMLLDEAFAGIDDAARGVRALDHGRRKPPASRPCAVPVIGEGARPPHAPGQAGPRRRRPPVRPRRPCAAAAASAGATALTACCRGSGRRARARRRSADGHRRSRCLAAARAGPRRP